MGDNINPNHDNGYDDNNIDIADIPQLYHTNGSTMYMNKRHVKDTKDGNAYSYATEAESYGLNEYTPIVSVFLHAQTTYVNSLHTYNKVNTTIQHVTEHLALTQLGTKAGIIMWNNKV